MNLQTTNNLTAATRENRLDGLALLVEQNADGIRDIELGDEVNNHVHTAYSFSPYYPAHAAWMARAAGLRAVGSVDHDSIGAARETIAAAKILRIGSTVGFELRVSFANTEFAGMRINNPDSIGIAYIVVHGVPGPRIPDVEEFLTPLQAARNRRNEQQVKAMNSQLAGLGAPGVSFEDVLAGSLAHEGGSVTERHILSTFARSLVEWLGQGPALRSWISDHIAGALPSRICELLDDTDNPHYVYDLLGVLKTTFLPGFFVQPGSDECLPVESVVDFANRIGAIPAYAYLGDVGESPTGDKKAEQFEDAYLDRLIPAVSEIGFKSVTYMPPRNTRDQLRRVAALCRESDLMQISGVDINSSRQSFNCPEIVEPEYRHLIDSTWALIAHEKLASADPDLSIFKQTGPLQERIDRYAAAGRAIDPAHPEDAAAALG